MAPSEFELRAALHDGEGEGVDAGRVIARARAVRATRRTRWATVAATVVVAGALGTGIGALAHYGGSESAGSAGGANAADSAAGAEAGAQAGAAAPQPAAPPATGEFHGPAQVPEKGSKVCEDTLPVATTPPAAGPGSSGPLLPPDTEAVIVCGYRIAASGAIARHHHQDKLVGSAAHELAHSLNSAPGRPASCPALPARTMLSITVNRPDIAPHHPVIITYDSTCGATATDGTAVRYNWTPPADLAAKLAALTRP